MPLILRHISMFRQESRPRFVKILEMRSSIFLSTLLLVALSWHPATAIPVGTNEYGCIIVGSGAGANPLACRLAMAGAKVLLNESGNDQAGNVNIFVP